MQDCFGISRRLCGCEATLRAGTGDQREGVRSRASLNGRGSQQPRGTAGISGRLCGCEAALRAGTGDQREGAGSRASIHGHGSQQPRGTAGISGRLCGGAKPLYERALAISEKALGAEHPDPRARVSTTSRDCFGIFQGDLRVRSRFTSGHWRSSEKALGAEHPSTGSESSSTTSQDCLDLRVTMRVRSRFTSGHWQSARRRWEPNIHPRARASTTSRTCLLLKGTLRSAETNYERALAIREKALGAEHPDTATNLNTLAQLQASQGDYVAARPLYERALAIRAESAESGASLNGIEPQQPCVPACISGRLCGGEAALRARSGDP